MVGDRLDSDVAFGHAGGFASVLVGTGCTSPAQLAACPGAERPSYSMDSFAGLSSL
jgi:ribonucleotide monophosphatase NagD (HAD superfamily)